MRPIIKRDSVQALETGRFYTGEPCKHGHYAERYYSNGGCVECVNRSRPRYAHGPPAARNTFIMPKRLAVTDGLPMSPELVEMIYEVIQLWMPVLQAEARARLLAKSEA